MSRGKSLIIIAFLNIISGCVQQENGPIEATDTTCSPDAIKKVQDEKKRQDLAARCIRR